MTATRRRTSDPVTRRLLKGAGALVVGIAATWASAAHAQGKAQTPAEIKAQGQALLAKYTADPGRSDRDGLLKEPAVRAELQQVVGSQLPKLMQNINVRGSIAFDGGGFEITGNAVHGGGEEEGVICVDPFGLTVEAGIFSKGKVTVFTKAENYDYVTLCVKDWITQVNSGHRDRFTQPTNVSVVKPR